MNVTFYIEDNKYKGNLTRKQILEAVNPVTQFNFRQDYEYLNHFLMQKMNENNSISLGQENFSARVFELSFNAEKNSYCVSMPLPCSYADFTVVFDFIKKLCAFLENNKVITGDGKEYTTDKDNFKAVFDFFNIVSAKLGKNKGQADDSEENTVENIERYPLREVIISSLKQTLETLKMQTNKDTIEISGIIRPVLFNEKMLTDIISSNDPVKNFSEFITDIQYLDAYSANQKIYSGKYAAIYTLKENETTVLPFKPKVETDALLRVKKEDVCYFKIIFLSADSDVNDIKSYNELGSMKYAEFIEKLPKEKYKFIDANQILIEGLSRKEIESLLA